MKKRVLSGLLGLGLLMAPMAAMADEGESLPAQQPAVAVQESQADQAKAMELLRKATAETAKLQAYSFTGTMDATTVVPELPIGITMKINLNGTVKKPDQVLMSMDMAMPSMPGLPAQAGAPKGISMQMYLKGKEQYMKMNVPGAAAPGSDQWMKQEVPLPQSLQDLMAQSQDPVKSVEWLNKMGLTPSGLRVQMVDGKKYYVLDINLDNAKMQAFMKEFMADTSLQGQTADEKANENLAEMLKNISVDFQYVYYINADTYLTDMTDLKGTETIQMEPNKKITVNLDGKIHMAPVPKDFIDTLKFPDVSNAVDMKTMMNDIKTEKTKK
ncbi:hypothetical protein H1S01_07045 [Heliobacterium chlorum]|uniref:Uncharacterized protein n=1 Tax=Heliobacterium chlorum TaxID=2698 RepID=A0ABR7T0E4_HELCL|nr:DUF6612 family protein [Heliobacterium chlorum]MBC9784265.1 hypothetical protein [Heliobacterium chlorum]